jgi:serine/threonine protein kinase
MDMWSLGCIVMELATGSLLFSTVLGAKDRSESARRDEHEYKHLQQVRDTLGYPPAPFLAACRRPHALTDLSAEKKAERPRRSIRSRLRSARGESVMKSAKWLLLEDLLLRMLKWDPRERLTPAAALDHMLFKVWVGHTPGLPTPDSTCLFYPYLPDVPEFCHAPRRTSRAPSDESAAAPTAPTAVAPLPPRVPPLALSLPSSSFSSGVSAASTPSPDSLSSSSPFSSSSSASPSPPSPPSTPSPFDSSLPRRPPTSFVGVSAPAHAPAPAPAPPRPPCSPTSFLRGEHEEEEEEVVEDSGSVAWVPVGLVSTRSSSLAPFVDGGGAEVDIVTGVQAASSSPDSSSELDLERPSSSSPESPHSPVHRDPHMDSSLHAEEPVRPELQLPMTLVPRSSLRSLVWRTD